MGSIGFHTRASGFDTRFDTSCIGFQHGFIRVVVCAVLGLGVQ